MKKLGLFVFAASSIAALCSGAAHATTGALPVSGTYNLTEDHVGSVIVTASNTTLNCQGHTIYSDGIDHCNGPSCGIEIVGKSSVKIYNCNLRDHTVGLLAENSTQVTVSNLVTRFNFVGMRVANVNNFPAHTFGWVNVWFQGYFGYNNEEGVDMNDSNAIVFNGLNRFRSNGRDGLDCELSQFEMLQGPDSYARRNGRNGIELDSCPNSAIWWFDASFNGDGTDRSGISIENSDDVDVLYCTANENGKNGIRVAVDSDSGHYGGNDAFDNEEFDMYQQAFSTNTWTSNSFGTKFGF